MSEHFLCFATCKKLSKKGFRVKTFFPPSIFISLMFGVESKYRKYCFPTRSLALEIHLYWISVLGFVYVFVDMLKWRTSML